MFFFHLEMLKIRIRMYSEGGYLQQCSVLDFWQWVLTSTLFFRTNVSTISALPQWSEEIDWCLYGVEWADLHVYIKCTPALFELRHMSSRVPILQPMNIFFCQNKPSHRKNSWRKECFKHRCFSTELICWTLTLPVFLLHWDAQWTLRVYYNLLKRNIFTDLVQD